MAPAERKREKKKRKSSFGFFLGNGYWARSNNQQHFYIIASQPKVRWEDLMVRVRSQGMVVPCKLSLSFTLSNIGAWESNNSQYLDPKYILRRKKDLKTPLPFTSNTHFLTEITEFKSHFVCLTRQTWSRQVSQLGLDFQSFAWSSQSKMSSHWINEWNSRKEKGMGSVLVTSFFNFGVEFDSTERVNELLSEEWNKNYWSFVAWSRRGR